MDRTATLRAVARASAARLQPGAERTLFLQAASDTDPAGWLLRGTLRYAFLISKSTHDAIDAAFQALGLEAIDALELIGWSA